MSDQRTGLVRGAGGAAGAAYHAGALSALQQTSGGTRAPPTSLSARRSAASWRRCCEPACRLTTSPPGRQVSNRCPAYAAARTLIDRISGDPLRITVSRLAGLFGGVRQAMSSGRWMQRPTLAALSTMLPHGVIDAANALEQLGGLHDDWPVSPLWMPAVRIRDGQRVVFGPDRALPRASHPAVTRDACRSGDGHMGTCPSRSRSAYTHRRTVLAPGVRRQGAARRRR